MFRRALAPAAVLMLTAACSGRVNDLDTYYDDPTTEVTAVTAVQEAPTAAPNTTTTMTTPTTTTPPQETPEIDPDDVLLTQRDLAGEGVSQASHSSHSLLGCAADTGASWAYPSGSTLVQTVRVLPDAAGRVAQIRENGGCVPTGGSTERPELGELGDDRHGWCFVDQEVRGCGAAVADGDLLTLVVVEAGSVDRARTAIERVAPLATDALDRV